MLLRSNPAALSRKFSHYAIVESHLWSALNGRQIHRA